MLPLILEYGSLSIHTRPSKSDITISGSVITIRKGIVTIRKSVITIGGCVIIIRKVFMYEIHHKLLDIRDFLNCDKHKMLIDSCSSNGN